MGAPIGPPKPSVVDCADVVDTDERLPESRSDRAAALSPVRSGGGAFPGALGRRGGFHFGTIGPAVPNFSPVVAPGLKSHEQSQNADRGDGSHIGPPEMPNPYTSRMQPECHRLWSEGPAAGRAKSRAGVAG